MACKENHEDVEMEGFFFQQGWRETRDSSGEKGENSDADQWGGQKEGKKYSDNETYWFKPNIFGIKITKR